MHAGVRCCVVVTERRRHAFEVVRDLPLPELDLYDGVLAARAPRACIVMHGIHVPSVARGQSRTAGIHGVEEGACRDAALPMLFLGPPCPGCLGAAASCRAALLVPLAQLISLAPVRLIR